MATTAAERFAGDDVPHFGARLLPEGGVRFRLWAPPFDAVQLRIVGQPPRAMSAAGGGWHELDVAQARAGDRYLFVLPDGSEVPDPASRHQPDDVHGPSEVIDPAFDWRVAWRGRAWEELVLYELHVGTFTPEGTFAAIIDKLDHLAGLGITALSLMPVADFPGTRNWGYDGVLPYAPDSSYGRPEDLKRLVDAAHARGLAVLLDVVYNHFGPEGNYLPKLAPQFFTGRHQTPWGAAINCDDAGCEVVREFLIGNALYWLQEFRLDGLRLDAVHAIVDESPRHLLEELARRARAATSGRPVHLLLENEHNGTRWLAREPDGAPVHYTAQWNDDVHHVLHVAATGEGSGYYAEYLGNTRFLARAIGEGFAFQGDTLKFSGRRRGEPSAHLPPAAFVSFIQNHDHVGNRAFGERIGRLAPPAAVRAIAAVYLLAPQIPMLFMGEEWDARQPFPFFCDFHGELAQAVREGRRAEFKRFPEFADPKIRETILDPQAPGTFASAKLRWEESALPGHAERLLWYRRILDVRRARIVPLVAGIRRAGLPQVIADGAVSVSWRGLEGQRLRLAANLSPRDVEFPLDDARVVWHEGAAPRAAALAPWSVRWSLADRRA